MQLVGNTREVADEKLKETGFIWSPLADQSLIRWIAEDERVEAVRIPTYIWAKGGTFVGLWMHGGGYMKGNGGESFPEAGLPIFN
jgi:hypothetical protein